MYSREGRGVGGTKNDFDYKAARFGDDVNLVLVHSAH